MALRDGRTSVFDLEAGTLGTVMDEWYKEREGVTQANFGTASSHEFARSLILDGVIARDTPEAVKSRAYTGMVYQYHPDLVSEQNLSPAQT